MIANPTDVVVRAFRPDDAVLLCRLVNQVRGDYLQPDDLLRRIEEECVVAFFVAVHRLERVVGMVLYAPTLKGRASSSGVYGRYFWVDPQFRTGRVAERLMVAGFQFAVNAGYPRMDAVTAPWNAPMLRLQRRAGARQVSCSPVGARELIEFVNYWPSLLRWLYRAFTDRPEVIAFARGPRAFDFARLLPPVGRGAADPDAHDWHGADVVPYDVRLGQGVTMRLAVDVASDAVASVGGSVCELDSRPVDGVRRLVVGGTAKVVVRFRNTADVPVRPTIVDEAGAVLLGDAVLEPGHEWEHIVAVRAGDRLGRHDVRHVATVVDADGAPLGAFDTTTWFDVVRGPRPAQPPAAAGSVVGQETDEGWRLANDWVEAVLDRRTGVLHIASRVTGAALARDLSPEVGPPYPPAWLTPPERPVTLVGLHARDGGVELEWETVPNVWWWRDRANVERAWPRAASLARYRLRRRVRLAGDQLLRFDTTLLDDGEGERREELFLRTFPWAAMPAPKLFFPRDDHVVGLPVADDGFPYWLDDVDFPHGPDLPADPGAYGAPWSAMVGTDGAAGALWPGADEVRFGARWLPSALYRVPSGQGPHAMPRSYLWCGAGDHRSVAAATAVVTGASPAARAVRRLVAPVDLALDDAGAARLVPLGPDARPGELRVGDGDPIAAVVEADGTAVPLPAPPDAERVHAVGVRWSEAEGANEWAVPLVAMGDDVVTVDHDDSPGTWVVANGVVRAAAAPSFRGALTGLVVGERDHLWSQWSERRGGTPGTAPTGGAKFHVVDPARRFWLQPTTEDVPWTVEAEEHHGDDGAAGVRLVGGVSDGRFAGLAVDIRWLLRPGCPLVVGRAALRNDGTEPLRFGMAFAVTAPRSHQDVVTVAPDGDGPPVVLPSSELSRVVALGPPVATGGPTALVGDLGVGAWPAARIRASVATETWEIVALEDTVLDPGESGEWSVVLAARAPRTGVDAFSLVHGLQ
ncbi:MAG: GNAT family N-acetyltransferase [Actinobacteria bacterium]|nr:GNAT family N-acetyltransferase [Actinomycetota bacterium]